MDPTTTSGAGVAAKAHALGLILPWRILNGRALFDRRVDCPPGGR